MTSSSTNAVDQRRAAPGGDAVGRDKITNHNHFSERRSQVDGWLERLSEELRDNHEVRDFVESLQYYFQPQPYDHVVGLEAKLDHAGRSTQKASALRKKEAFAKLLAEWGAYPSAQEVIAYFLSKIEATFETEIVPLLASESATVIDTMIRDKLIAPVLDEMGCGPFMLNYGNVAGMPHSPRSRLRCRCLMRARRPSHPAPKAANSACDLPPCSTKLARGTSQRKWRANGYARST